MAATDGGGASMTDWMYGAEQWSAGWYYLSQRGVCHSGTSTGLAYVSEWADTETNLYHFWTWGVLIISRR